MSIVSVPQNASAVQATSDDAIGRIERDPAQLDMFGDPPSQRIALPPCGRGGPCQAVIEHSPEGAILRCTTCNCIAPYCTQKSSTPTPAAQSNDALGAVLDGFAQGQLKFMKFLREQANAPGDPGNSQRE
jgi:hypothetical protein